MKTNVLLFQYKKHDSDDFDFLFEIMRTTFVQNKSEFYERNSEVEHTFLLLDRRLK